MDLIEKLSEVAEGSRELDREIQRRLGVTSIPLTVIGGMDDGCWLDSYGNHKGMHCARSTGDMYVPKYSTSIDAALTLVPEGMEWDITTIYHEPRANVGLNNPNGPECGVAPTPALALCIASLKAREVDKCQHDLDTVRENRRAAVTALTEKEDG